MKRFDMMNKGLFIYFYYIPILKKAQRAKKNKINAQYVMASTNSTQINYSISKLSLIHI